MQPIFQPAELAELHALVAGLDTYLRIGYGSIREAETAAERLAVGQAFGTMMGTLTGVYYQAADRLEAEAAAEAIEQGGDE